MDGERARYQESGGSMARYWSAIVPVFLSSILLVSNISWASDNFSMSAQEQGLFSAVPVLSGRTFPFRPIFPEISSLPWSDPGRSFDEGLLRWIRSNVSAKTGMFLSFQVLPEESKGVYEGMGAADSVGGIIERVIVENGLVIYDGAVAQIALALSGGEENMRLAQMPLDVYWKGTLGALASIRSGFSGKDFIYDPQAPDKVSAGLEAEGRRGFIFRIINAHGDYLSSDPLDGKKRFEGFPSWPDIHWEDWKPVAGENAWVVIAAMHIYHKKYFNPDTGRYAFHGESVELRLSEELARAAMILQSETGGIRMAPQGTFRENESAGASLPGNWWYEHISTENNFSWYSALRMLYCVTGKEEYRFAMTKLEGYFRRVFDREKGFFYQGMSFQDGAWQVDASDFAVDVQTWGILSLGAEVIDGWFGDGAAYSAWQKVKSLSSTRDRSGRLIGVGYTAESERVSVEWSAGAIMSARELAGFYAEAHPDWSEGLWRDAGEMRAGMDLLRRDLPGGRSAYAYSSKRGWIPFGWNSHDPRVMSLASTGWMFFVDKNQNPFFITTTRPGSSEVSF